MRIALIGSLRNGWEIGVVIVLVGRRLIGIHVGWMFRLLLLRNVRRVIVRLIVTVLRVGMVYWARAGIDVALMLWT